MIYNLSDIVFWNSINIDHIEILLADVRDLDLQNKLINYRNEFNDLNNNINNEEHIYLNIKTHSQFINDLSEIKKIYQQQDYSLNHMINEGICGYRILLIIEQKTSPIPLIENIRIQEMLLAASIDHLKYMIREANGKELKQLQRYYYHIELLRKKQNQAFLYFSQYADIKKILNINKHILQSSTKHINFYKKLKRDNLLVNHIIKEEEYYISLLARIKKALGLYSLN